MWTLISIVVPYTACRHDELDLGVPWTAMYWEESPTQLTYVSFKNEFSL